MSAKAPTETTTVSSISTEPTPGQQLAAARQAKGLTLAQISQSTRILEYRLEAIERDDYSEVGISSAFVIGYVKAFAAQVDLPSAPLIATLGVYFKQREMAERSDNPAPVRAKSINLGSWIASGLALIVFLGLGQWYITQQARETLARVPPERALSPASEVNDHRTSRAIENVAGTSSSAFVRTNISMLAQEQLPPALSDSTSNVNASVGQTLPDGEAANPMSSEQPVLKSEVEIAPDKIALRGGGSADAVIDTTSAHNTVANRTQSPSTLQGKDELVLTFSGECWLEVFDGNGVRLVARLAKSSENIALKGLAPFDIKLGNAHFAKVKVNGREVELSPSPNRRVLRIQVGP
ncbi:RodZ domain-containing protein [Marinagarivorans algicola]|uniref:RodZ domain-containing protein n=1 Tax=Marinagarivorans algicola TaxID=1513270 RepID=UPI0006B9D6FD|nr:RodZ domain-containing protein [Marinagarivorans algicola]